MRLLAELVASHEDWLTHRIREFALQDPQGRYHFPPTEELPIPLAGLAGAFNEAVAQAEAAVDAAWDEGFTSDPVARFGAVEARHHRERSGTPAAFQRMVRHYRQAYIELLANGGVSEEDRDRCRLFLEYFFERLLLGFALEWGSLNDEIRIGQLRATHRKILREKNKYLGAFESLGTPLILLDRAGHIENLNHAAAALFDGLEVFGAPYYEERAATRPPKWLDSSFLPSENPGSQKSVEVTLDTTLGTRHFIVESRRLLDESESPGGAILAFHDVTEQEESQARLAYRSELSRIVSEISTEFVGLNAQEADSAIERALQKVGSFMGADSAYTFRFSDDGSRFSMTHLWQANDEQTSRLILQDLDAASMPWWMERLRNAKVVAVTAVDELPEEARIEREILMSQGIQSLLDVPLTFQDQVEGFMGLACRTRRQGWTSDEIHLMQILGQALTNTIRHHHAEQVLARERHLLRTLIDYLPDYIYVKDAQSRFVLNNAAHLRLLKAESAEDVYGKTDYDIFPEQLASRYYADEQAAIRSGEPLVNREEVVVDERGRKLWVLSTKVPFRDVEGNIAGIVGMSRNITERKRLEEALENHAKLLEKANADLHLRNQELDEFTYIASHDLQEPLRKLTAFSDVLREDLLAGEHEAVLRDLEVLSSGAQRMQQLVQDLLALSRSSRQKMSVQPVPLDRCVDRALDALELRIKETGAQVVREKLPVVRGDLSLLTQLFQNLIGNALKFHTGTAPHVEISCEPIEGGWRVSVKDEGIGIKPEYAEQIFAPFKRLHSRGKYEGTGIGLAICRKIVERHGGVIWVESELGKGATFKFTLKQQREAAPT